MVDALYNFGPVDELKPEAIGMPGNRRFRILFRKGRRTACFWMEKVQLGALADAVNELLMQMEGGAGAPEPPMTGYYPEPYEIERQTARLALDYNEANDLFSILLFDVEGELALQERLQGREEEIEVESAELQPTLRVDVTRAQLERFYNEAAVVIQSGRPPTPTRSRNGHHPRTDPS